MPESKEASNIKNSEQVRVVVRCRPMNTKEFKAGFTNVVNVAASQNVIEIHDPKEQLTERKMFTFDAVYDFTSTQEQVYRESVEPIVGSVLDGYNATIFAYGQTGTGKTYTMEGKQFDREEKGVIPRSFDQIFEHISYCSDVQHIVRCSYIEIYQEEIKDLLDESGNKTYELRGDQSSVYIKNLKSYVCENAAEMERTMKFGNMNRKTGATDMNEHSSRSHAIFIISIEITRIICDMKHVKVGKLNLVDLAGSERQTKSKSSGIRLKEATKINLSLSALGNVISALSKERNSHIPYRDSKLTRILQDSLGGNAKTLMIANIGPACYNYVESLNTLKYANRAKNIKNKPIVNEDSTKDELIRKCRMEVERLKMLIESKYSKTQSDDTNGNRANRKRNRNDLINEEIFELQDAVEDEECRLYNTCEKIVYLQEWKDYVEGQIGTDILAYTESQRHELQGKYNELEQIDLRKEELKRRIEQEERKAEELQSLNVKQADSIVNQIESLYKTYNALAEVKNETATIKDHLENKRIHLETTHNRLLERHGMNQIIIDHFLPQNARERYKSKIDKDLPPTHISKRHDNQSHSSERVKEFESNSSRTNLSTKSIETKQNDTYSQRLPFCDSTCEHKFKDNIIHTCKSGMKQNMENERPCQKPQNVESVHQRDNKFNEVRTTTLRDSLHMLKNLLVMG